MSPSAGTTQPLSSLAVATSLPRVNGIVPKEASDGCTPETLAFVDAEHGWLALGSVILATSDGGATWAQQYHATEPMANIQDIDFVDAEHGFAVVGWSGPDTAAGIQFHEIVVGTANGGLTWSVVTPEQAGIQCLDFLTPAIGYAITAGQNLAVTSDRGWHWRRLAAVAAPDATCFGAGGSGWVVSPSGVERTSDGGASWASVTVPGATFLSTDTRLECFGHTVWLSSVFGAGMNQEAALVMRSLDDGAHWRVVDNQGIGGQQPGTPQAPRILAAHPGPFQLTSQNDACLTSYDSVATDVQLTVTSDGGYSFAQRPVVVNEKDNSRVSPDALSFVTPADGWLLMDATPQQIETSALSLARTGGARLAGGLSPRHLTLLHTSTSGSSWTPVAEFLGSSQVVL